jgi:predicted lipid-binding transport protein (Tim44 family)
LRKTLALFAVVLSLGMTTMAFDAEAARRLGGGRSTGMQKQNVTPPATAPGSTSATPSQAAPAAGTAATAAPAAAAAPKRSWMGPIAGLAAGLGLAALASHLGMGEAFGNMLMIGLLVMGVLLVVGMVMRKRAAAQAGGLAGAGAGAGGMGSVGGPFGQSQSQQATLRTMEQPQGGSMIGSRIGGGVDAPVATGANVGSIPADFDAVGFARNAQDQFMALQSANDAGDLDRLRGYLTPEMFEAVKADIAARGNAPQQTQVFGLTAQVLNVVEEAAQYVVSVRFTGSVRDEAGAVPEDLDEVWHLTKPRAGMGGWVIAGIQQGK